MPALLAVALACLGAVSLAAQRPERDARFGLAPTVAALRARVGSTDAEARTITGSAWLLAAFGANGSNLRTGGARDAMKELAFWLRSVQTEDGRFAPGGVRCSRSEQLIATLALCEAGNIANYMVLKPTWDAGARTTAAMFAAPDAPPVDGTEAGLLTLLASRLAWANETALAEPLYALARPAAMADVARTRRDDAGRMLARQLLGIADPADLIAAVVWPPDLAADPLHTFLAVNALTRHRDQLARHLEPLDRLAARRAENEDDATAWTAADGYDATTTTALLTAALGMTATWVVDHPRPR